MAKVEYGSFVVPSSDISAAIVERLPNEISDQLLNGTYKGTYAELSKIVLQTLVPDYYSGGTVVSWEKDEQNPEDIIVLVQLLAGEVSE